MTATQNEPGTRSPVAAQPPGGGLAEASLPDSVAILLSGVVPAIVRGLFTPRRARG